FILWNWPEAALAACCSRRRRCATANVAVCGKEPFSAGQRPGWRAAARRRVPVERARRSHSGAGVLQQLGPGLARLELAEADGAAGQLLAAVQLKDGVAHATEGRSGLERPGPREQQRELGRAQMADDVVTADDTAGGLTDCADE